MGFQAMKAGILEIADIVVVNKSDLPDAEEAVLMLREGRETPWTLARRLAGCQ